MPMFEDIVQEIENTQAKIDYIIFAFRTRDGALVDVLAVRKKYIWKDCDNQGARIYYYAGLDRLLNMDNPVLKVNSINPTFNISTEERKVRYDIIATSPNTDYLIKLFDNAVYCVYFCRRNGLPYATQPVVQACNDVINKYLIRWEKGEREWEYAPICSCTNEEWRNEILAACKKYGVELPDDKV